MDLRFLLEVKLKLLHITLGGKRDEQMLDNIDGLTYKNNMLHYNFPSFSVEVR